MSEKIDIRLSGKERVILELLIGTGRDGMYGLQLVQAADGDLARGTVYVTLERMEEKGLVSSRQEEKLPGASGIPRRIYRPTGYGMRALSVWKQLRARSSHRTSPQPA